MIAHTDSLVTTCEPSAMASVEASTSQHAVHQKHVCAMPCNAITRATTCLVKPCSDSADEPLTVANVEATGICALVVRKLWSCEQSASSWRICAALCTLAPMPPLMPTACSHARTWFSSSAKAMCGVAPSLRIGLCRPALAHEVPSEKQTIAEF